MPMSSEREKTVYYILGNIASVSDHMVKSRYKDNEPLNFRDLRYYVEWLEALISDSEEKGEL